VQWLPSVGVRPPLYRNGATAFLAVTDLLRAGAGRSNDGISRDRADWPKNPRALAGRLRRAQSFLRALGIDLRSVVKAEPETGLSGFVLLATIPSAPSAASATMDRGQDNVRHDRRVTSATTAAAPFGHRARSGKSPSQSPTVLTVLTVLTQMPGFSFSGSQSEDYWMGPRWPTAGACGRNHHTASIPPEIFEPVRAQVGVALRSWKDVVLVEERAELLVAFNQPATPWSGSASDLLSLCAERARADVSSGPSWTKNPRALAGRLRRAQTFLRMRHQIVVLGSIAMRRQRPRSAIASLQIAGVGDRNS
jgi:hypothetical protein